MALLFNRGLEAPSQSALPTGILPSPSTGITNQFLPQGPNPFFSGSEGFGQQADFEQRSPYSTLFETMRGGEAAHRQVPQLPLQAFGQAAAKKPVKKKPLAANAASRFRNLFMPGGGGQLQNPFLRF